MRAGVIRQWQIDYPILFTVSPMYTNIAHFIVIHVFFANRTRTRWLKMQVAKRLAQISTHWALLKLYILAANYIYCIHLFLAYIWIIFIHL